MAIIVDEADLRILVDAPESQQVASFIGDAILIVSEEFENSSLSNERLNIIAKYLAAHYYILSVEAGGIFEEEIGDNMEKRGSANSVGMGLNLSRFGQTALSMDSTGTLVKMAEPKRHAQFRVNR